MQFKKYYAVTLVGLLYTWGGVQIEIQNAFKTTGWGKNRLKSRSNTHITTIITC